MGNIVPLGKQEYNDPGFDNRVKRALAEALDGFKSEVLSALKKNPADMNAIKVMGMLSASGPLIVHFIKGMSHQECVSVVNTVDSFLARVLAVENGK